MLVKAIKASGCGFTTTPSGQSTSALQVSIFLRKLRQSALGDGRGVLGLNDGVEITVCHGVEMVRRYEWKLKRTRDAKNRELTRSEPQVGYDTGDVFSSGWLPSGSSIIFSVPREHLSKDLAIFIRFNYEWEYEDGTFRSDEPEHRVYFRTSDLPKQLQ
jgi:hypothetical protein